MILFAAFLIGFSACEKLEEKVESVLDLNPLSELAPETYFKNETDLQLFTNSLYLSVISHTVYAEQSDLFIRDNPGALIRNGNMRITPASGSGWSWAALRKINVCLEYMKKNCEDERERIILESIFLFATRLNMRTVAEGVETGNYFVKSPATEDVLVISLCHNISE